MRKKVLDFCMKVTGPFSLTAGYTAFSQTEDISEWFGTQYTEARD